MENQFKPDKLAFIASRIFNKVTITFVILLIFFVVSKFLAPETSLGGVFFILFLILGSIFYALESIVYKKLTFTFYDDKIIQKGGSLFTDYETQLNIKNITHVKLRLPFIENKIFNTAHIDIESAGSSASEIHLCSMIEYKEIHRLIMEMMNNNGFRMDKGELVMTERPDSLGVFFEVFKSFVAGLFVVFYLVSGLLYDEDGDKNELIYDNVANHIFPIIALGVFVVLFIHVFKFLDLKRRVYEIYQNVITYREGFLSKNYSLLPFENLTDSSVTQTLVDKIFALYDVKLSCQGSRHEILFKNIRNGKGMSDKLDILISNKGKSVENHVSQIKSEGVSEPGIIQKKAKDNFNYDYKKQFKMDYARTVKFPLLLSIGSLILLVVCLFISSFLFSSFDSLASSIINVLLVTINFTLVLIVPLLFINIIVNYIKYKSTTYDVRDRSVHYKYNFLTSREAEFTSDKVTGVVMNISFIDNWFRTMNINFWSIGASSSLNFAYLKREDKIIENIVSKFGIRREREIFKIRSDFRLSEYLKSFLPLFLLLFTVILLLLVSIFILNVVAGVILSFFLLLFFVLDFLYKRECYRRTSLTFCENFMYFQKGWLFRKFYYVKYDDVKDITTTRYPFSDEGSIKFNVAGERVMQSGRNGRRVISNSFVISFVSGIREKDELIDYILFKRPQEEELINVATNSEYQNICKPNFKVKPSLANILVPLFLGLIPIDLMFLLALFAEGLGLFGIVIFLVLNMILILPFYLSTKMTTYFMDGYRIFSKSGVIFKRQTSILYDKIDFINNNQRFWNKVFKNGNVAINTVGSSRTELSIKNIPNFKKFYDTLKDRYKNK